MAESTPHWNELRERLLAIAAAHRGAQSKLAREIGASRQAVSLWLAGTSVPGGEAALHLQKWVNAEEAKNKEPRKRLHPLPEQETRTERQQINEIHSSSPPAKYSPPQQSAKQNRTPRTPREPIAKRSPGRSSKPKS